MSTAHFYALGAAVLLLVCDPSVAQEDMMTVENVAFVKTVFVKIVESCDLLEPHAYQNALFAGTSLAVEHGSNATHNETRTVIPLDQLKTDSFVGDGSEFIAACKQSKACVTIEREGGSFGKKKIEHATRADIAFCGDPSANRRLRAGAMFLIAAHQRGLF